MTRPIKQEKENKLYGLDKVTEVIKIIIASGYIKNEKPLSLIITAPISNGKTTSIKQFKEVKGVLVLTDLTMYGVLKNYQEKLRNNEIRHIIIPDFLNVFSHRNTTINALLTFINTTSEDGVFPIKSFALDIHEYIAPFGWILCLTKEAYHKKEKYLKSIGFENRFLKLEYNYSFEVINKILDLIIAEDKFIIPTAKMKLIKGKKEVKGNPQIFRELVLISNLILKNPENKGELLRQQRKLQTFLKSCALLRNDNQVRKEDLDKLKNLIELIK